MARDKERQPYALARASTGGGGSNTRFHSTSRRPASQLSTGNSSLHMIVGGEKIGGAGRGELNRRHQDFQSWSAAYCRVPAGTRGGIISYLAKSPSPAIPPRTLHNTASDTASRVRPTIGRGSCERGPLPQARPYARVQARPRAGDSREASAPLRGNAIRDVAKHSRRSSQPRRSPRRKRSKRSGARTLLP